jgi:bifunctional DNase/RNase
MAHPPRSPTLRVALLASLGAAAALACGQAPVPTGGEVPVRVDRIAIDDHNTPVVVLEEEGGPRWLPIWIGTAEAHSIALQIEERSSPRPNSHDLTRDLIHRLDGSVERVVVTELRGNTYYAVLGILRDGRILEIDARPSDAIAIALRDGAPIFVRETLFEQVGGEVADEIEGPKREI